ncbi:integrase [Actinoalloteichus hoggarensis]|uniref:Putative prophage phiRv2 integrase n=1 Tax=Actinoalloteichus hoggarensis TaxID=1470176 RepID=A0A221W7J8_9PSEU|nr:site-specific integrase [Actinoalloteichus hoggarensis]ASO21549.1 Putative prophage phiRv2 integrase [Actinoalloteichus hoggarensis]MBB5922140.1 integrase [Actinoalloteichus hoggarensis]
MGHVVMTPSGKYRANWREPSGTQRAKTFRTKREATAFLARIETQKADGGYVSPHAGRMLFGEHAARWMATWNTAVTTRARDASVMRTHVLPQWSSWQLGKIDEVAVQGWITDLGGRLSAATVAECHRLAMGVLRSAVRNKLIVTNPAAGVRLPRRTKTDRDEFVITREVLRSQLLPAVPDRHRAFVTVAAGSGMRWGEIAGLAFDAVDLTAGTVRVARTVVEVSGRRSVKATPKTAAGRRIIPLPRWALEALRNQVDRMRPGPRDLVFATDVGTPLSRGTWRARVWRPSLVRAGLLGEVEPIGANRWQARWTDTEGYEGVASFDAHRDAVLHVARHAGEGMTFHDLRHSYATWLVDDGVPINMVQRVLGHERSSTTLDIYTRRTDNSARLLDALDDPDDDEGTAGLLAPLR